MYPSFLCVMGKVSQVYIPQQDCRGRGNTKLFLGDMLSSTRRRVYMTGDVPAPHAGVDLLEHTDLIHGGSVTSMHTPSACTHMS